MDYIEFEKLLGKNLSSIGKVIDSEFRKVQIANNADLESDLYSNNEYFSIDFFGMACNQITLLTSKKNDKTKSISIHFRKVIDHQFYGAFIEKYGKPDNIQIIESRQVESESVIKNDDGQVIKTLRKSTFGLREGRFEEKPLYIIWKKETFEIKAFLRHEQNISEVTFSLK